MARLNYARRLVAMGGWTPTLINGTVAWYDGLDLNTLYQDSGLTTPAGLSDPVGGWLDKASLTYHQAQTSTDNKPTYTANAINGRPALVFDGNDYLINAALGALFSGSDKPFSVWMIVKQTALLTRQVIFSIGNSGDNNPSQDIRLYESPTLIVRSYRVDDTASAVFADSAAVNDTNPHVFGISFSGTTISVFRDGATIINNAAHNCGTMTVDQFAIGAWVRISAFYYFIGAIGENVVINRAINTREAALLNRYMGDKWGITLA